MGFVEMVKVKGRFFSNEYEMFSMCLDHNPFHIFTGLKLLS